MSAILTVTEAATQLRKSERFILDELRRKNLRGSKYGGGWHITSEDLSRYIEAHMNVSAVRK